DAITTLQMQELSVYTVGHKPQQRSAEAHGHVYIRSSYGVFATADGFMALAMPDLQALAEVLEQPRLAAMDAEADGWHNRDRLFRGVREALQARTTADWMARFQPNGIWAAAVYGYDELLGDPQIAHNGTFVEYEHPTEGHVKTPGFPIRFSKTPSTVERGAPVTGQHSRDVLREIGFSDEDMAQLGDAVRFGELP